MMKYSSRGLAHCFDNAAHLNFAVRYDWVSSLNGNFGDDSDDEGDVDDSSDASESAPAAPEATWSTEFHSPAWKIQDEVLLDLEQAKVAFEAAEVRKVESSSLACADIMQAPK
jgi:hypothetical protein